MTAAGRPIRAIAAVVAVVAVAVALVVTGMLAGGGGVELASAGKPESRRECKEKPRGSHEWREHHCGRFR